MTRPTPATVVAPCRLRLGGPLPYGRGSDRGVGHGDPTLRPVRGAGRYRGLAIISSWCLAAGDGVAAAAGADFVERAVEGAAAVGGSLFEQRELLALALDEL